MTAERGASDGLCVQCDYRAAQFTVDTPGDGIEVCALCLGDTCWDLAEYGHEWPYVFEGQYPRYLKVTPRKPVPVSEERHPNHGNL